ncbi:fused MFS/spermidine synthase [Lysinibacter sp. HNR]|uniref:spermidine synthase n=1 Tax=Lysinibacter sp. HNR TaxID=3031408 RepID=UPI00243565A0|nr:fused MFS/spermidine synthase [Lysinibacter sp. HNR]WGD36768.1 fused MFS/spermidine synthase [Lysinibacter sp. HNR]
MNNPRQQRLSVSGYIATIEKDRHVPGAYELVVDGTPQSHVNMANPKELFFEYVQRMGHVIDLVGAKKEPLTALHLGGGAFTLPRYIEATRPGSRQQIVELESDLVDFVRRELPLPKRAPIRIRHGDAREVITKLPGGLTGNVDIIVVDIFSGAQTPAHVTSQEFYATLRPLLSSRGVLLVNVADGPGLAFARSQVATVGSIFSHVSALAEAQVLKGRRFGNVVLMASQREFGAQWIPRLMAGGPHPARVITGTELANFAASGHIVTDNTSLPSPPPARSIFQV